MFNSSFWKGVPIDKIPQWQRALSNQTSIFIANLCPVCGAAKLRQYYHLEKSQLIESRGKSFIGKGSYWAWCANCGAYEHALTLIPADWVGITLSVNHSQLTPLPTELELAATNLNS